MLSSLWDNQRLRSWAGQILLLALFGATIWWLADNTLTNLAVRSIRVGFDFLWRQANFPISESIVAYDPSDTFFRAYLAGIGNTLLISAVVIVLATLLGLVVGLGRRSRHPLVAGFAGAFVTLMRNVPLIVQLLFWYALLTTALPPPRQAWQPLPGAFLSLRGLYLPGVEVDGHGWLFCLGAVAGAVLWWRGAARVERRFDLTAPRVAALLAAAYAGWLVLLWLGCGIGLRPSLPRLAGFNFEGGLRLSPEFTALTIGLVIYTSAFIGEIIRGGVDAVARGQWEAGRAVGLSDRQTLFHIVIPQALRIIIPPLTTQYLSTVKNSTLAVAVGFPELGLVVGTVINQTGQAIENVLALLLVFLTISTSVSLLMNWYNARVALVSR
ncbi:MAG: ABC transporter permease subunit [Alphaproteobacteria bacterium]|jgi:general L-amino acid transport system permease protein|nr:ABC transporter permease subunit [Alphaproteobacteria bacterium]